MESTAPVAFGDLDNRVFYGERQFKWDSLFLVQTQELPSDAPEPLSSL